MIRSISICALMITLYGAIAADELPPDAVDWYEKQYAPLYVDNPAKNARMLARYFSDPMIWHPSDGDAVEVDGPKWIRDALNQWLAEGWTHSKLVALKHDRINSRTVAFKAKWHDFYSDGSEGHECGWYLADFEKGKWIITQYADLDCVQHGL